MKITRKLVLRISILMLLLAVIFFGIVFFSTKAFEKNELSNQSLKEVLFECEETPEHENCVATAVFQAKNNGILTLAIIIFVLGLAGLMYGEGMF